jgi:hypothetical protein
VVTVQRRNPACAIVPPSIASPSSGTAAVFVSAGIISRLMRASLIEALRNDYIRTALAKGLPRRVVAAKHALLAVEAARSVIGVGAGSLEDGVGRDHLARHEVSADAEVLGQLVELVACAEHLALERLGQLGDGDGVERRVVRRDAQDLHAARPEALFGVNYAGSLRHPDLIPPGVDYLTADVDETESTSWNASALLRQFARQSAPPERAGRDRES